MTTRKQLERGAKGREYREPKLTSSGALGLAVSQALAILGVKTLGLPTVSTAYNLRLEESQEVSLEELVAKYPRLKRQFVVTVKDEKLRAQFPFKVTVEVTVEKTA